MLGKFEITTNRDGKFQFHLKAGNGEVVISSANSYEQKTALMRGIASVRRNAANARVVDLSDE